MLRAKDMVSILTCVSAGQGVAVVSQAFTRLDMPNVVYREFDTDAPPVVSMAFIGRRHQIFAGGKGAAQIHAVFRVKALNGERAPEHGEDDFPVSVRRAPIINIAVGKSVAVRRAAMKRMAVADVRTGRKYLIDCLSRLFRRRLVMFGKAAIDFAAASYGKLVRREGHR